MVEKLITWSARNPFLIGLMTLALIAGACWRSCARHWMHCLIFQTCR